MLFFFKIKKLFVWGFFVNLVIILLIGKVNEYNFFWFWILKILSIKVFFKVNKYLLFFEIFIVIVGRVEFLNIFLIL